MKFDDAGSLPAKLQAGCPGWQKIWNLISPWVDLAKLPPLHAGVAVVEPLRALALAHQSEETRGLLKTYVTAEELDRFTAAFCRQVPRDPKVHFSYNQWQWIAKELGGPETAAVMTRVVAERLTLFKTPYSAQGTNPSISTAAGVLGVIGDVTCLPAMMLCLYRLYKLQHRFLNDWLRGQIAEVAKRNGVSHEDADDWCVPDEADPEEVEYFSKEQAGRLERAMLAERRWTPEMFERRIVRQPILWPLAAGLVWGYYDAAGRLMEPFQIGADFRYPAVPEGARVGIVHPAHLPAGEVEGWRERTKALPAPFAQWKPAVLALEAGELAGERITRLPENELPAATLLCRLEALGWKRPKTRTMLQFHVRPFPELGVAAVIRYPGIPLTYGSEWTAQKIEACFFLADNRPVALSKVSPIAISAVLADLETLRKVAAARR